MRINYNLLIIMNGFQKEQLKSLLLDVNVYCLSAKNAVVMNKVSSKDFFQPEIRNWQCAYHGKSKDFICGEIARIARNFNKEEGWDEWDVDGFSWHIGIFSLVCEKAGLVGSFDEAFKTAYRMYINKGLVDEENPEMLFAKAMQYYNGNGVPKNLPKAAMYFEQAAELGDSTAQYNIGQCYEKAIGVAQNDSKALYWYTRAAENGDLEAISNLGMYYYTGKGTSVNYEKAVMYWTKASKQNDARATYNLGVCYREGQGVPIDYDEARQLFNKAIKLGHPTARLALSQLERLINRFGL